MFQTKVVGKMKHILSSVNFSPQSCHLCVNVEKCGKDRQVTRENIMLRRKKYCTFKQDNKRTHS